MRRSTSAGDGILSNPLQRNYWTEHFLALRAAADLSSGSAEAIRLAAVSMDAANAKAIERLMTGYSKAQLIEGGDEELVAMLDSPSMPVRVLAIENLRAITGTSLYFRAEQENAIRRESGTKAWRARQRNGTIRYLE